MIRGRQPITEAGFIQEPLGKQYFDYARYTAASFVRDVELKWHPGRAGISLDDFVMDTSIYAIELAKKDYAKGLFPPSWTNSGKTPARRSSMSAWASITRERPSILAPPMRMTIPWRFLMIPPKRRRRPPSSEARDRSPIGRPKSRTRM